VELELQGERQTRQLDRLDDYTDVDGLLRHVNAILADHDMWFVQVETGNQTAHIVVLDVEEQARLEQRGWGFRRGA
jgi:hypothetical protein